MPISINGSTGITGVVGINAASANTPVILQDSGTNSNTCRAWVNFNGTGTPAIRASFNVSSITDNGAGQYRVNFATSMPDVNYAAVASDGNYGMTNTDPSSANIAYTNVYSYNSSFILTDVAGVTVAIFR